MPMYENMSKTGQTKASECSMRFEQRQVGK